MSASPQTSPPVARAVVAPDSALTPRAYRVLVTVHVLTGVGLLGADLALFALGTAGAGGAAPHETYPAMSLLAEWVVVPLALTALVSGLLVGASGRWVLLRHGWVVVKLAVTVALSAALLVVLVPGLDAAAAEPLPPAQPLLYALAPAAASILLTTNVLLGRHKPGRAARTARLGRNR